MMMSVEVYLRRGQRSLQRLGLDPRVRAMGTGALRWASGFFLSAAGLLGMPQPLAAGLICASYGVQAVTMALGAMVGYVVFWGLAGAQGIVWSGAAGLLTLLVGKKQERQDSPLMMPCVMAFLVSVTGLVFRFFLEDSTPVGMLILQGVTCFLSAALFIQAFYRRDPVTDWLVCGVGVLALSRVRGLGYVAAGCLAVYGAFPAAVLAGVALDLAQIGTVPMTAVVAASYFVRMIPFDRAWQGYAAPALCYLALMGISGTKELEPLPGLLIGSGIAALLPPKPRISHRRGGTGLAQVRLEMGAGVLASLGKTVQEMELLPIDEEALVERAKERACESCSARRNCTQKDRLTPEHLLTPLEADCRKPGRLIPELHRSQEQLRYLKAERGRQREYRGALAQQYAFLAGYMRQLSDSLIRASPAGEPEYRVEVSLRSQGKEKTNGDRCFAFPGTEGKYYVLLCDGMGTGVGAAQEGLQAGKTLRQMLTSGFPASYALGTYNDLLALRGSAGAVTMDLAEVRLDTGQAVIYKRGGVSSWVLGRKGVKRIGTASAPPGISVERVREKGWKLSLCQGEVLVLVSDGVDGEDVLSHHSFSPDMPLGELAAKILDFGGRAGEDDATVAVLRLRPLA